MIHSYPVWFLWWLRHGAIGPSEATSFVGLMSTDLTSEFTHFNLVIRLSNVQQLALPFCIFSRTPAAPDAPGTPVMCTLSSEATPNCQTPSFFAAILERQSTISWQRNQAGTRLSGVAFFLLMVVWWGETYCAPNSLELESRLMPIGTRTDHGPGAGNNRTICRYLGTESCFLFGFVFTN